MLDQNHHEPTLTMSKLLGLQPNLEEDPSPPIKEDEPTFLKRTARNLLRFLLIGTVVSRKGNYKKSLATIEHGLDKQKNNELLTEVRNEMQNMLNHASAALTNQIDQQPEANFEIFLNNGLAVLPFIDPPVTGDNSVIDIPQKIGGIWTRVKYKIGRIDISPQTGLLAKLIEDEDRIYAYTLESIDQPAAQSHLLLMGTTYPTGQGAALAALYNFYPGYSVGEAHDTTHLDQWLKKQPNKKINCTGQSKGAVMSMITAARHSDKINQASCFNPTALSQPTLNRLNPTWDIPNENKPIINVYAQEGDPCFPLQKGFLSGTNIYRVSPHHKQCSDYKKFLPTCIQKAFEAHIQIFTGRDDVTLSPLSTHNENHSRKREFRANLQDTLNWLLFPMMYFNLCSKLINRKLNRFYETYKWPIRIMMGLAILGGCAALATTIFFAPLASLILWQAIAIPVGIGISAAIALPKIVKKTLSYITSIIEYACTISLLIPALLLTALTSMITIGIKSLFTKSYKQQENNQNTVSEVTATNSVTATLDKPLSPDPDVMIDTPAKNENNKSAAYSKKGNYCKLLSWMCCGTNEPEDSTIKETASKSFLPS